MSDPFGEAARNLGPVLVGARGWRAVYAQPDPSGSDLPLLFERDLVAFAHFGVGDERTIEGLDGDRRISSCERFANFVRYLGPGDDLSSVPRSEGFADLYLNAWGDYYGTPLVRSAKLDDYVASRPLESRHEGIGEPLGPREVARVRLAALNALPPGGPYEPVALVAWYDPVGRQDEAMLHVYCRDTGHVEPVLVDPYEMQEAAVFVARAAVLEVESAQRERPRPTMLEGAADGDEPSGDERGPRRARRGTVRRPGG